jgi:hypothetical protein
MTDPKELAERIVRAVLKDLSDRAGVPEWLDPEFDETGADVARDLVRDVVLPILEGRDA